MIKSPYTYDYLAEREKLTSEWPVSQTVEDDSISIRELLDNFVRGMPPSVNNHEGVDDNISDDLDDFGNVEQNLMLDFDKMDLTEIDDVRRQLNARAAQLRKEIRSAETSAQSSDVPSQTHGDSEDKSKVEDANQ